MPDHIITSVSIFLAFSCYTLSMRRRFTPIETGTQFVVRADLNAFAPALNGMTLNQMKSRLLFREQDSGRFALELILGPDQEYPSHLHGSNEWCFVVEGDIGDQFGWKGQGDFFYNEKHSRHFQIRAGPNGCRLFVVKDFGDNVPRPEYDAWSCGCG